MNAAHKRHLIGFALALTALLFVVLVAAALLANRRALERGIPPGLPEPLPDAAVSPFCINAPLAQYEGEELDWAADLVADSGFVWVRQTFSWAQIEPQRGEYDWERWDDAVAAATARGLRLIAVLDATPPWSASPPDPADLARFAAALAARYGEQISYYQVWNNPNLADGWGAEPNPAAYAQLLQQTATAIRAADPDARILLAGLAPTVEQGPHNLSEVIFLERLYAAGAAPYFDILAAQPYGFDSGPDDRRVAADVLNFSRPILLRETMLAHGDGDKPIWASHFGWNSPLDSGASIWGQTDPQTQADYTVAAVERARREWPWMGAMCLAHFQPDLSAPLLPSGTPNAERDWGFAAVAPDATQTAFLMGASGGHVFLAGGGATLASCTDAAIVDKVGWGGADCAEGDAACWEGACCDVSPCGDACEEFSIVLLPDIQYYTSKQADNASNTYYTQM